MGRQHPEYILAQKKLDSRYSIAAFFLWPPPWETMKHLLQVLSPVQSVTHESPKDPKFPSISPSIR